MNELPIRCPDCERRHWSISAIMACECATQDEHGYAKPVKGGDWIP